MQRNHAFSLVEILVAVAILAVLAVMAGTAVSGMTDRSQTTQCLSNLRQIGAAVQLYAADANGRLPSSSHHRADDGSSLSWTNTLAAYLGTNFIGRCPAVPDHPAKVTYGWNDLLTESTGAGIATAICRQPGATIAVAELATNQTSEHFHFRGAMRNGRLTANQFRSFVNVEAHGNAANYLFVDGHVENIAWTEVRRRLVPVNSTFLNP